MTGKPGRSGGSRPGAGPPFKKVTLRQGDTWVVMSPTPQTATVEVLNRNTVVLKLDDGAIIKLVR
jgi:hypothetical protein